MPVKLTSPFLKKWYIALFCFELKSPQMNTAGSSIFLFFDLELVLSMNSDRVLQSKFDCSIFTSPRFGLNITCTVAMTISRASTRSNVVSLLGFALFFVKSSSWVAMKRKRPKVATLSLSNRMIFDEQLDLHRINHF